MNLKNSMILANMMSQKPKIMYATIKGTLTENDGVFSGFSASNYLALQQPFTLTPTTKAEFVIKAKATEFVAGTAVLGTFGSYGISLQLSNVLHLYLGDGSSWNIVSNLSGRTSLSVDTDYWVKIIIDNGNVSLLLSTDGITYTTEATTTMSITESYNYNLTYGIARLGATYFRGSIDLNNSYIKLGSTKYNLQAVVGYTIVGSPTIVDGVVSGFSSANYLTLSTSPNLSEETEIVTKINRNSNNNAQFIIGWKSDSVYSVGIYLSAGKIIANYQRSADGSNQRLLLGTKVYDANTDYYIKLIKTNNSLSLFYSTNGNSWEQDAIAEFTDMPSFAVSRFRIGVGADTTPNAPFDGSIYINETYIKVNNKLWFNGQQA